MKIRTQLVLLVVAALLPVAIFAGMMTARLWELQRETLSQQFQERVRALRIALDTELDATVRSLRALADSRDFTEPPLDLIAPRLRHIVGAQPGWETMGVLMPDGTPVIQVFRGTNNILVPDDATVAEVLRTRAAVISNLTISDTPPAYTTYVAAPVIRGGALEYVLYAGIDHRAWLAFLQKYPIAERATLTLNDGNGLIIARTLNDERWVGKPSSPEFRARTRAKAEDSFRNTGLEGQAFYSAYSTLSTSGWTLGTGVPQAEVEAALRGSSLSVLTGIAVASVLALLLALLIGRRIAGDVGWLASYAKTMADPGRAPESRALAMQEAASVHAALQETERALHEREARLSDALESEGDARAVAEDANRAKDQFLAMLGHELRNPLSAIATAAALLETPGGARHLSRSTEIVKRQVRHLTAIVNELLDVARITSGKVVLTREILDLSAVTRHAVTALQDAGRARHATIACSYDEVYICADETRIEQIVTNLVDNALKFTDTDARIEVAVRSSAEHAILEIRDNGKGIAPELLPRMFDLFEQGERTRDRTQGGLGIGLTVVRSLVEQHGGSIAAASAGEGRGCAVTVRLPRVRMQPKPAGVPATGPARPQRILVVDDNADNRNALAVLLRDRGHDVIVAGDGPGAVAAIEAALPEIAILDIGLPGFDGMEVARRVRANAGCSDVWLVALSGYGGEEDRAAAMAAGFDGYMIKPFDCARFEAAIARLGARTADVPERRAG